MSSPAGRNDGLIDSGNPISVTLSRSKRPVIRVGTRQSQLALIQANYVISELTRLYGDAYEFQIVSMTTTGDHILDRPLSQIGSKALFTKELEDALLAGDIDLIVHSMKDLPTTLPDGCSIGAVLKRENPCDALVIKEGIHFSNPFDVITGQDNKQDLVIGTSSLRRISQLRFYNPSVKVVDIRGNLNTRFRKLDDESLPYDALLLACAGLIRGGFKDRISLALGQDESRPWFHAVGQGALAIECRFGDEAIMGILSPLLDYDTIYEVLAERSLMYTLEGGCSVPIGVRCSWREGNELTLEGAVFSVDGQEHVENSSSVILVEDMKSQDEDSSAGDKGAYLTGFSIPKCPLLKKRFEACSKLGSNLAKSLNAMGADRILAEMKKGRGDGLEAQNE
ncbi:Porphobilinogen deaminase [Halotydeus destructor]|nr:Porphobilinogen deaminase [Halotydeus destructor]